MNKTDLNLFKLEVAYFHLLRGLVACRLAGLGEARLPELLRQLLAVEEGMSLAQHEPRHTAGLLYRAGAVVCRIRVNWYMAKQYPHTFWFPHCFGDLKITRWAASKQNRLYPWPKPRGAVPASQDARTVQGGLDGSALEAGRADFQYALALRAWILCRQSGLPRIQALEERLDALEASWIAAKRPPGLTLQVFLGPQAQEPCLRLAHLMAKHFPEGEWGRRGLEVLGAAYLRARSRCDRALGNSMDVGR